MSSPDWRDLAACLHTDPESFFPEASNADAYARRVCACCPVRAECLEDALAPAQDRQHGIRGGLSANQRRALLVKRNSEAVA